MKLVIVMVVFLGMSWAVSPKSIPFDDIILSTTGEYKNSITMLLSFFPFSYAISRRYIDDNYIYNFAVISLVIFIYAYFVKQAETMATFYWRDSTTNNGGYFMPLIFPLLGVLFNKRKLFVIWGICVILTVSSLKRGAILCIGIETLIFFYFYVRSVSDKRRKTLNLNLILMLCFSIAMLIVLNSIYQDNIYLQDRLEDTISGDSSGRDSIYEDAISKFTNSNFFTKLMGHGFMQTPRLIGMYAHSDWLELLVGLGILGVSLYCMIFLYLFIWYIHNKSYLSYSQRFIYLSALSCWFVKSVFSMAFNAPEASMLSVAIAIVMGQVKISKQCKN